MHLNNPAERAIQTFKANFISILAGVSRSFPKFLWDNLFPQTELMLNLLCQSNIAPEMYAWEHYNGPFNFDATPIDPLVSLIIIQNNPGTHKSWDYRGSKGFTIGPAFKHYRCFEVVDTATKSTLISDTIEVLHDYLTQPEVTHEERIIHVLNFLSCSVRDAARTVHHEKISTISKLRNLFRSWKTSTALTPTEANPALLPPSLPKETPPPRVVTSPRMVPPPRVESTPAEFLH